MLYLTPPLFYDKDGKQNYGVVSKEGTFSQRPTGTYPYVVLYTATDRDGETYRLEANTDGSVSSNWVSIGSGGSGGTVLSELNAIDVLSSFDTEGIIIQDESGFRMKANGRLVFNNGGLILTTTMSTSTLPLKATNGIVAEISDDKKSIELSAELYLHKIYINKQSQEPYINLEIEIYNRSSTPFTYDTLVSYLNTSGQRIATGTKRQGDQISVVTNVIAPESTIMAVVDFTNIELEQANVTITDNVEQI